MNLVSPIAPVSNPSATAPSRSWRGRDVELRSSAEIEAMRRAGQVVRAALEAARGICVAGATTREVDAAAHAEIDAAGAEPLFLHYPGQHAGGDPNGGFPAVSCVSVNEEIVHGIPGTRVLADGDLVTVDCGVRLDGWCADAAITVPVGGLVGAIDPQWNRMLEVTESILETAIELAVPGRRWSDIAARLESMAIEAGFGIVEGYVGHGIGRRLHEAPEVACSITGDRHVGRDFTLRPGMTIAIEPILALRPGPDGRTAATRVCEDGWTVVTADGSPACHVEHTVAITRSETLILTA